MEAQSDFAIGWACSTMTMLIARLPSQFDCWCCETFNSFRVENRTVPNEGTWRLVAQYKGDAGECSDADCLCRR
jgi:hypothetical protein